MMNGRNLNEEQDMKYDIDAIINKEQSIKLTSLYNVRMIMCALENKGLLVRNKPIQWSLIGSHVIIQRPPELGLKILWTDDYSDHFIDLIEKKINLINAEPIPNKSVYESLPQKIAQNIMAKQQEQEAQRKEFESAVRIQLGYPDHEPLPSDPLFVKLFKQIGASHGPRIELNLEMVPTKKRAMILLAMHAILTH